MRKPVIAAAALALVLPSSGSAQRPSAAEVVARHLEARGGAERLRALRSVVYSHGVYHEGDFTGNGTAFMAMARPYFKTVGDPDGPNAEVREGFDGSAWEWYADPGIVVRTVGAAAAAIRHNLDPDGPLSDYRVKGTTIAPLPDATIDGRPAYGLLVTLRDGFAQQYYIDKRTWLIVAQRKSAPIHAFGEKVTSEERFSDYRDVGGILFPFRVVETEIGTNRPLSSMQWGSIEINRDMPRSWFSPPVYSRTPLQEMLEGLYAERSDTSAVRWTYLAFRRAHSDVDTHRGIEAIGYQMLKMGDLAGAVALLQLNAADYPQTSSSAFALGRAYRSAGRNPDARREFERAIRLDPTNTKARDALLSMPGAPAARRAHSSG